MGCWRPRGPGLRHAPRILCTGQRSTGTSEQTWSKHGYRKCLDHYRRALTQPAKPNYGCTETAAREPVRAANTVRNSRRPGPGWHAGQRASPSAATYKSLRVATWFAILFTGRYPRGIFDYVEGVARWRNRVIGYALTLVTGAIPRSGSSTERLLLLQRDPAGHDVGGVAGVPAQAKRAVRDGPDREVPDRVDRKGGDRVGPGLYLDRSFVGRNDLAEQRVLADLEFDG